MHLRSSAPSSTERRRHKVLIKLNSRSFLQPSAPSPPADTAAPSRQKSNLVIRLGARQRPAESAGMNQQRPEPMDVSQQEEATEAGGEGRALKRLHKRIPQTDGAGDDESGNEAPVPAGTASAYACCSKRHDRDCVCIVLAAVLPDCPYNVGAICWYSRSVSHTSYQVHKMHVVTGTMQAKVLILFCLTLNSWLMPGLASADAQCQPAEVAAALQPSCQPATEPGTLPSTQLHAVHAQAEMQAGAATPPSNIPPSPKSTEASPKPHPASEPVSPAAAALPEPGWPSSLPGLHLAPTSALAQSGPLDGASATVMSATSERDVQADTAMREPAAEASSRAAPELAPAAKAAMPRGPLMRMQAQALSGIQPMALGAQHVALPQSNVLAVKSVHLWVQMPAPCVVQTTSGSVSLYVCMPGIADQRGSSTRSPLGSFDHQPSW